MNKRGMGYLSMVIVFMVLVMGAAVTSNADFDVDNFKNNLNWTHIELNVTESPDLGNALESFANGLGEAGFSIAKWAAQWGSENPTVPFKLLIYLFLLSIIAPILILVFKLLIIIALLTKEFFQSRKEKQQIKRLKKND